MTVKDNFRGLFLNRPLNLKLASPRRFLRRQAFEVLKILIKSEKDVRSHLPHESGDQTIIEAEAGGYEQIKRQREYPALLDFEVGTVQPGS